MSNDRLIWDKLTAAGMTSAGAAGLLGNLYAESGLNPKNLQNSYEKKLGCTDADYTAAVDCGAYTNFVSDCAGYGLAQWTHSSRKAALLAYARARGASIGDLDMQVGYLLQELQSLFPALRRLLCATASVREASDAVLLQFERPADQSQANLDRRFARAQEFYNKLAGGESMDTIMTAAELCAKALDIAENYKTSYMLGPWGWPANDKMITRATTQGMYAETNKGWLSYANKIKDRGFLFDCIGLIKGILWGWCGDMSRTYGGAGYEVGGLKDWGADTVIQKCTDVSTDFSTIVPGEAVWMTGHIGVYVGNGVVVESTPRWKWGVQKSTALNVSRTQIPGTVGGRTWTKHGKLPWVDYTPAEKTNEEDDDMKRFEKLKDVPASYQPTIKKLMECGALKGRSDPDPNRLDDNVLDVSEDYCRVMTTLDLLGKLD